MLTNGTFLNSRYEILGKVGSGGMSDVYKAKCHKLNRFVAIKVLKQEFSEDKNFVTKFRAEAQAAAGLTHPNIVNIYDVNEDNGLYYIVMELVEGITLKSYIDKKGRLDIKEAVSIAIQVAQGIHTAHSHHIIHRDIKPQNIIISKEGKVKVTDFGIARASSAQTINSNAMGSVHYISPEQARGSYSDERSDIYSLGVSLYEMVTGRVPFEGDTTVAVALQHIQGEIPSPKEIVPDIPISVEKIIYKCTQKKPERRYAKASELIVDLKKSLVTPDEDFVQLTLVNTAAPTISLTDDEVTIIKQGTGRTERASERKQEKTKPAAARDLYEDEEESYRINPKVERIMTILSVVAAVLIVCLLVFIVVKLMPGKDSNLSTQASTTEAPTTTEAVTTADSVGKVEMPDVRGLSQEDALVRLTQNALGLADPDFITSAEVEKGLVISQEYEPGTMVQRNSSIKLVISSGPEKFELPPLEGMSEQAAKEYLESYKLTAVSEYVFNDEIEQGYVINSNPPASAMVSAGDSIIINVSKGPEFKDAIVPALKDKTLEEAKFAIEANGFIVGNIEEVESTGEAGIVIGQSIEEGKTAKQGTSIDLIVSKERENLIGSATISRSQVAEYITTDGRSFANFVVGPGASEAERYAQATLRLELTQTTGDGRTISRNVDSFIVTPEEFPVSVEEIEGEPGILEGSLNVYLSFGGKEYSCGSCLVEFH